MKYCLFIVILLFLKISYTQVNWTKYANNPVQNFGAEPVVICENDTFKMWFAYGYLDTDSNLFVHIGYSASIDGINWDISYNNPVLAGDSGTWSYVVHDTPFVLKDSSGYRMWFVGSDHIGDPWVGDSIMVIGYAQSDDGIHWTEYPDPVLFKGSSGSWDFLWLESPSVIYDEGEYKMWYTGQSTETGPSLSQIGYATSPDGINWIKYPNNPVIEIDANNDYLVGICSVVKVDSIYYMWYNGATQTDAADEHIDSAVINLAFSFDGFNWTKYSDNPVMTNTFPSADTNNMKVWAPSVIFKDNQFMMWYGYVGMATAPYDTILSNIKKQIKPDYIKIYPNPSKDFINVCFYDKIDNNYYLTISDINGKIINKTKIINKLTTINVSNIPKGIYTINIFSNSKILSKKIIKN